MAGSVSPLPWTGNKGCIYTTIDAFMPPHRTYVEACMGSAEVFLRKKPVEKEIINDYNGDLVRFFRVLQRNENLERLIGRLFLSFNSEQIFRANKALLAEVPNILDDLTETSVIIENIEWNDFDLAVASAIKIGNPPQTAPEPFFHGSGAASLCSFSYIFRTPPMISAASFYLLFQVGLCPVFWRSAFRAPRRFLRCTGSPRGHPSVCGDRPRRCFCVLP